MSNLFVPQLWRRDSDTPAISLGHSGAFDDKHLFAPCVAYENKRFVLWYSGSRATVAKRVFNLGMATSTDGINFTKHPNNPVFTLGDGNRSILTPTILRSPDGTVLRENGRLRMWFVSTDLVNGNGLHTLHESASIDGQTWVPPGEALLDNVYAPTIIKEEGRYMMWYIDVASDPWYVRYAESRDGTRWEAFEGPVLQPDQDWEAGRLFYPTVVKCDGRYLMWYGSYFGPEKQRTALGFAISGEGRKWVKHPENPVFEPEPAHEWESHYTTSQSVLRLPDSSWRIWYASRTMPPFTHKYFAIGTARMETLG